MSMVVRLGDFLEDTQHSSRFSMSTRKSRGCTLPLLHTWRRVVVWATKVRSGGEQLQHRGAPPSLGSRSRTLSNDPPVLIHSRTFCASAVGPRDCCDASELTEPRLARLAPPAAAGPAADARPAAAALLAMAGVWRVAAGGWQIGRRLMEISRSGVNEAVSPRGILERDRPITQ